MNKLIKNLLIILLTAIVCITSAQVFLRYGFDVSLPWAEKVILLLTTYIVFIAGSIGVRDRWHISFDYFFERFPKQIRLGIWYLRELLVLGLGFFMAYEGYELIYKVKDHKIPTLPVSEAFTYIPLLLAGVAIAYFTLMTIKKGPEAWNS